MDKKVKYTILSFGLLILGFVALSFSSGITKMNGDPYEKNRTNWVDFYYQEALEKSPELKELEKEIKDINSRQFDLEREFSAYHYKSKEYYNDASLEANRILDTTLKRKMYQLISTSSVNYNSSVSSILANLATFKENEHKISDYYTVLKLVKSMESIEKYQKTNKPYVKKYEDHIRDQNAAVEKIKSRTPAY